MCWDPSGDFLASVSDDLVRVWSVVSSARGECIHELSCSGNKFNTCVFHPTCPSLLVIGCYEVSYTALLLFTLKMNLLPGDLLLLKMLSEVLFLICNGGISDFGALEHDREQDNDSACS